MHEYEVGSREWRLRQLGSYVPRILLRRFINQEHDIGGPEHTSFPCVLLFADISGFTPLTEKFARKGVDFQEYVSKALNFYFGRMIDIIVDVYYGDIIKFAGDAVFVIWTEDQCGSLENAINACTKCALALQSLHNLQIETTDFRTDIRLSVKIVVTVGTCTGVHIGGERDRFEYFVAGEPIVQINKADADMGPGKVLLSPDAWEVMPASSKEPGVCKFEVLDSGCVQLFSLNIQLHLDKIRTVTDILKFDVSEATERSIRKYIPYPALLRIDTGLTKYLSELRRLTILFVMLPDFDYNDDSEISRAQDAVSRLQRMLYRFEGTMRQYIQDDKGSVLIGAFGLPPMAHEDDASRGVQCALEMVHELSSIDMVTSIGVTTGKVFCGYVGSEFRREFAVIGDSVNLSARLMVRAGENNILCDANTKELSSDRIEFEELEPISVKGKSAPIHIFKPLAVHNVTNRRKIQRAKGMLNVQVDALIGREEEMLLIKKKIMDLKQQRNSVIWLEGVPGSGKSRLLEEVMNEAERKGVRGILTAADSIRKCDVYYAFRHAFWELLDLGEEVEVGGAEEKTAFRSKISESIPAELQRWLPLLNSVLPFDFPENDLTTEMNAKVRSENTLNLLVNVFRAKLPPQGLLLCVDDAQWLDASSWVLLLELAERVDQGLLLFLAGRPTVSNLENSPPERAALREIAKMRLLEPLSAQHMIALVCKCLGVRALDDKIAKCVTEQSQGNPFVGEQIAYTIAQSNQVTTEQDKCVMVSGQSTFELEIPNNVEELITSRIDTLSQNAQMTLKFASVIGRTFDFPLLLKVYPKVDRKVDVDVLQENLTKLEKMRMIRAISKGNADPRYAIDELTREVAYNLLVASARKKIHLATAKLIEEMCPKGRVPEMMYSELIYHYTMAGQERDAVYYLAGNGEIALRNYDVKSAISLFQRAVELGNVAEGNPDSPVSSFSSLDEGVSSGSTKVDSITLASWKRQYAEALFQNAQYDLAFTHLVEALELLGHPIDPANQGLTNSSLMTELMATVLSLGSAKKKSKPKKSDIYMEKLKCLERLAEVQYLRGDRVPAAYTGLTAASLAKDLGPCPETARIYATLALSIIAFGPRYKSQGEDYLTKAKDIAESCIFNALEENKIKGIAKEVKRNATLSYVMMTGGSFYMQAGDWEKARANLEHAKDTYHAIGDRSSFTQAVVQLAQIECFRSRFSEAEAIFKSLDSFAEDSTVARLEMIRGQATCMIRTGRHVQALDLLAQLERTFSQLDRAVLDQSYFNLVWYGLRARINAQIATTISPKIRNTPEGGKYQEDAKSMMRKLTGGTFSYLVQNMTLALFPSIVLLAEAYCWVWNLEVERDKAQSADAPRSHRRSDPNNQVYEYDTGMTKILEAIFQVSDLYPVAKPSGKLIKGWARMLRGKKSKAMKSWANGLCCAREKGMVFEEGQILYMMGCYSSGKSRQSYLQQAEDRFRQVGAVVEANQAKMQLRDTL
eukprot:Rmarinus@m.18855